MRPEPIQHIPATYVVLALSALFEGFSRCVALSVFRKAKGSVGYIEAARLSKDPTSFTVLFEDSAALIGLGIAFIGIFASEISGITAFDGVASIGVGLVLAATAVFLGRETKSLLIGEQASPRLEAAILKIAEQDPALQRANGVLTVHLAPDQIVAAISAEFKDEVTAPEIEASIERIESAPADGETAAVAWVCPKESRAPVLLFPNLDSDNFISRLESARNCLANPRSDLLRGGARQRSARECHGADRTCGREH
jgi:divalent metal cation (Fe/Co/Zn/Cd) transporter